MLTILDSHSHIHSHNTLNGNEQSFPNALRHLFQKQLVDIPKHYSGVTYKLLHTVLSSFIFFYVSTIFKALYVRKLRAGRTTGGGRTAGGDVQVSIPASIMLSSMAAMVNTCITLPLDALVTHHQMGDNNLDPSTLWSGLAPSLLLSLNPALHYTIFDAIKALLVEKGDSKLSARSAFLAGMAAKYISTIATYPLIRAKVVMMASSSSDVGRVVEEVVREEGWGGWYNGLGVQLGHTILKAGLVLSIRERVGDFASRIVQ